MRDSDGIVIVLVETVVVTGRSGSELSKDLDLAENTSRFNGEIGAKVTVNKTPVCDPRPRLHRSMEGVCILIRRSDNRRAIRIELDESFSCHSCQKGNIEQESKRAREQESKRARERKNKPIET